MNYVAAGLLLGRVPQCYTHMGAEILPDHSPDSIYSNKRAACNKSSHNSRDNNSDNVTTNNSSITTTITASNNSNNCSSDPVQNNNNSSSACSADVTEILNSVSTKEKENKEMSGNMNNFMQYKV